MGEKSDLAINYYLTAFIDVLGQQDALQKFNGLPDTKNKDEMDEFLYLIKNTFGVVNGIYESFKNLFDAFIRKEKNSLFSQFITSNDIKLQRFSDGLVIFLSLRDDINKIPIQGIYLIITACGSIFLLWLSQGQPLRVGIDIGLGVEMKKNELYGPVVYKAYKLESQIAQYPRIVLGDELMTYLHLTKELENIDFNANVSKKLAKLCLSILIKDDDGYPILDYLGENFKNIVGNGINGEIVLKAYEFLVKQSEKWREEKKTKHAFRYTLLRGYFDAKLPLWIDKSE